MNGSAHHTPPCSGSCVVYFLIMRVKTVASPPDTAPSGPLARRRLFRSYAAEEEASVRDLEVWSSSSVPLIPLLAPDSYAPLLQALQTRAEAVGAVVSPLISLISSPGSGRPMPEATLQRDDRFVLYCD